jgi:hypothetical protein
MDNLRQYTTSQLITMGFLISIRINNEAATPEDNQNFYEIVNELKRRGVTDL